MINLRQVMAAGSMVWFLGCTTPFLPAGPSILDEGIVIYEDVNFRGSSGHVLEDISSLTYQNGPCDDPDPDDIDQTWNDCISSVRVAPGWRAILYRASGFDEESLEISQDTPSLRDIPGPCREDSFNDCVSSIRVFAPPGRAAPRD